MQQQEFLSAKELAKKLNKSVRTVEKWTQDRRVPGQVKCGGRWIYRIVDVERALLRGDFLLRRVTCFASAVWLFSYVARLWCSSQGV
jgi:predicted site-specific integrase-resolvase